MPTNRKHVKLTLQRNEEILKDYACLQYLWSVPDNSKITDTEMMRAGRIIRMLYLRSKIKRSYEEIAFAVAQLGLEASDDALFEYMAEHEYHNRSD